MRGRGICRSDGELSRAARLVARRGDRELFTRTELAEAFDLRGISGGNAVFNAEKLDWFNQQHMLRLSPFELGQRVKPYLEAAGLWRTICSAIATRGSLPCSSC
jgi:glutamyl/glutaminyl-tRNA synthetase